MAAQSDWRAHFEAQCAERNRRELKPFKDLIARFALLRQDVTSATSAVQSAKDESLVLLKDRDALAAQVQELQLATSGIVLKSGREKELEDRLRVSEAECRKALMDRNEFLETQLSLGKAVKANEDLSSANAELARKVSELLKEAKEREATFVLVKNELSTLAAQNELLRKKQAQLQTDFDRYEKMVIDAKTREGDLLNEILVLSEKAQTGGGGLEKGSSSSGPSSPPTAGGSGNGGLVQNLCYDTKELGISLPPSRIVHRIENTHDGECYAVSFAENCKSVWTGGNDKLLRQYDVNTGQMINRIQSSGAALCLDLSSGKLLAGCADSICRLWEVATMRNIAQLTGHSEKVTSAFLSPTAHQAFSASSDRTIKVWDAGLSSSTQTIMCYSMCTDFSVANERICAVHIDGSLRLYDTRNAGKLSGELKSLHDKAATSVRMTPDGNYAISVGRDNCLKLVDLRKLDHPLDVSSPDKLVISTAAARLALSPDAALVACGSSLGGNVIVWPVLSTSLGKPVVLEGGHTACATSLSWSPDGRGLATLGQDKRLVLWR
jgi:hypothetical protein